ncbi:hypothetical protein PZB74_03190 [Porifericola rhodea]|uniref:hypothetical protein n=1 Tax=Porifericola rhodea TaxID=930972 RepID=UPI002666D9D7|nr:hypothetical protein [Porifericola rhodea]WKN32356.1 hypothetical protein PZB74_03190 [Porifericola rhodea]
MIKRQTEWLIRISGGVLLIFALFKLYIRPLTHSYHDAFLFTHLQIVLWLMLALIMALIVSSFSSLRAKWLMALIAFLMLAPYALVHQPLTQKAESYFFRQRYDLLEQLNSQLLDSKIRKEQLYDQLAAMDIRNYEIGTNYIAYWVDRMPEQRDGFIFILEGEPPAQVFGYPVNQLSEIHPQWFSFTSG